MTWENRSSRRVFRDYPAIVEVNRHAEQNSWRLVSEEDADFDSGVSYEVVWLVAPQVLFHYVEDEVSQHAYFYLEGRFPGEVDEWSRRLAQFFAVWAESELRGAVTEADTPQNKARALLRLALGAPWSFDDTVLSHVQAALQDSNPNVRTAGVYATTYSPLPEYRPLLRRVAENDSDVDVKNAALAALTAYDQEGVGET